MRKILCCLLLIGLFFSAAINAQSDYPGLNSLNEFNWANYVNDLLGYVYDSHGCLHFYPSDAYLIYKTIPSGIALKVNSYRVMEQALSFSISKLDFLSDMIKAPADLDKQAKIFRSYPTRIEVYPSLSLMVIFVNNNAYAKVKALAGQKQEYLMAFSVTKDQPIEWDFWNSTPTDPGNYTVLRTTDHYISSAYYKNTIVPFGAWIRKIDNNWFFQEKNKWYKLPANIAADLISSDVQKNYDYYDLNFDVQGKVVAARYAGHDFGKYVLLWSKDGKNHYPEMGYSAGVLVYEQVLLIKDLVYLLTAPNTDEFDALILGNDNFMFYKGLYDFKTSKGEKVPDKVDPLPMSYYKLFNHFALNEKDQQLIDPRVRKAFEEYEENRLPRDKLAREQALGLYNYLLVNSKVIDKQAYWYEKVKKDWEVFRGLRIKLRDDFGQMGVLSIENQQNIVEKWINERMEFRSIVAPQQAKNVSNLTFSSFFKPDEETLMFSDRERQIMVNKIKESVNTKQDLGLKLDIVDALNNYNFGVLLNGMLGDLYKSHGCMHVSPRNMTFLFDLLPMDAYMKVYDYSARVSEETISQVPYLANLINYKDDLDNLKEQFNFSKDIKIAVYPFSGDWIIYVKDKAFCRLSIKGGPQNSFYLVQGRDKEQKPIFQAQLAYPTTPGDYYIFKKTDHYVSNIYYDQTLIPMGGSIFKQVNKWVFMDDKGKVKEAPGAIKLDLSRPLDQQEFTYYDLVKNASNEVVSMKWGSNPFGKFALQTTKDHKIAWPELIHSSGDLIMEERQLVNDLINILTAPNNELDDCVLTNDNFSLYRACWEFVKNPRRKDLIQAKERAAYLLYYNYPLTSEEASLLPQDMSIAGDLLRKKDLTNAQIKILINEGIAYKRSNKLKVNMEKILGLRFDNYQYVVTIQKYAHHYEVLKQNWEKLSVLRSALLKDFNNFVLNDNALFHNFMRELMLKRNNLEQLTQQNALELLNGMLEGK